MKLMAAPFVFVITAPLKTYIQVTSPQLIPAQVVLEVHYLTVHYMVNILQGLYENKCRKTMFSIYLYVSSIYCL